MANEGIDYSPGYHYLWSVRSPAEGDGFLAYDEDSPDLPLGLFGAG
jgi:hypothetical protein